MEIACAGLMDFGVGIQYEELKVDSLASLYSRTASIGIQYKELKSSMNVEEAMRINAKNPRIENWKG
jgi:hypothetical protein